MPDFTALPPLASSIVETIGQTPLVELRRLAAHLSLDGRLLAKLEYFNPGFSKKDRNALAMVRSARESGELRTGQTVVELTSGNTGTGLAIACRALGHPFVAVISKGNTIERARMMQALGATVVRVDQAPGSPPNQVSGDDLALVERKTQELVDRLGAFRADQFKLPANAEAHDQTAEEIWRQANGAVEFIADFSGTAASFTGLTRTLRRLNPDLRAYLVEPATAAALAGGEISNPSHRIQGGGYSMTELPLLERGLVTDFMTIADETAMDGARLLAAHEGIFGGFSAGANLMACVELLRGPERGRTAAFLVCDSGLKYLSTDLYPWRELDDLPG